MSEDAKRWPPGPRSWIPGKVFRELRRDPLAFLTRITREYGDICSFAALGRRYIIVNHPDLVREILLTQADAFWKSPALQNSKGILGEGLLTAEGETHRLQRRLIQPAFHAKYVESYAPEIVKGAESVVAEWRRAAPATLDIRPPLMGLTLTIAARALFGSGLSDGDIRTVERCMNDLMANYVRAVVPWGWLLNHLPLPTTRKLAAAQRDLFYLVNRIIEARRATEGSAARDLLSTMLAATDAGEGCPAHGGGVRLTDQQLRDQCITILTAGHETTANALTFTLYLLARHPREQDKLRAAIAAPPAAPAQHSELSTQHSVRNVLCESMRLLPPVWTVGRQNQRPVTLGGYTLPAKCTILIPQWTLHRDARFFPDPLAFKPDRWQNPAHPRFAYIPFSTGPRNCIGESFAWLEMMLALPMLVRKFQFTLPPNAPDLALMPAITLRPRGPVLIDTHPLLT